MMKLAGYGQRAYQAYKGNALIRYGIWGAVAAFSWYLFGGMATRMLVPKSLLSTGAAAKEGSAAAAAAAAAGGQPDFSGRATAQVDDEEDEEESVEAGARGGQMGGGKGKDKGGMGDFGEKGGQKYEAASDDDEEL